MISLVTACMNRESHVRASLPEWLKFEEIGEVVIVDWSTSQPFDDLVRLDPRVRIVRAVDEPRWVLSYAYNLGIAQAKGDVILKCDADCVPQAGIVACRPEPGKFYAGDWKTGDLVGKTCVNGQCVFTKTQWAEVNGYSELLRRYGYDDTDFYKRLEIAGHARTEISPTLLEFLPHSDRERVANHLPPDPAKALEVFLHQQLAYHEAINMMIIAFMPWGRWFPIATYTELSHSAQVSVFRRDMAREIPLSDTLMQVAKSQALRTVTGRLARIPTATLNRMDDVACATQLLRIIQAKPAARGPANAT